MLTKKNSFNALNRFELIILPPELMYSMDVLSFRHVAPR